LEASTFFRESDRTQVLSWLRSDAHGTYSSTRFDNLRTAAGATAIRLKQQGLPSEHVQKLATHADYLYQDWTNLLSIITKLDWMSDIVCPSTAKLTPWQRWKQRWIEPRARIIGFVPARHLPDSAWMAFATSDIDMFLVEVRSAFDHLAGVVSCLSEKQGQVPDDSYRSLVKWRTENNDRAVRLLGNRTVDLIVSSAWWFEELRSLRDSNVHGGGRNMVFPLGDDVCFMSFHKSQLLSRRELRHGERFVSFSRLAGYVLVAFWVLAEEIAAQSFAKFQLLQLGLGDGAMAYHVGKDVLRAWCPSSGPTAAPYPPRP